MNTKPNTAFSTAQLRRRAEARLRERRKNQRSRGSVPKLETGPQRLFHELQVHQIELEMQNAELHEARDRMEVLLEKFTDLYDFAPAGYFSLDEQGRILEVNLTGATLLGVERARLINRSLPYFVAPASQPAFQAFLKQVFGGAIKQACEATLIKADGATFWAGFHGTSAISLNGARKWCRIAVSDITSLKQAEALLLRNEALFSALIEQAPVGVYVMDDQLRLQQTNPKARTVFGKISPLKGRDLSEILHTIWPKTIADEIVEHFRHTLQTGKPYYSREFSGKRRDIGVTESYEWQLQRITLPAGDHGVVCFFSDITERKQAEAALLRVKVLAASNQKLEREIVRRQAVEKSLKQSEQHHRHLLVQSNHMQEQLRHLSRQVLQAQEEERKRISRELHDVIAQTLTGINVRLATLKKEAGLNTHGFDRNIERTQKLVEHSVNIVHEFARELRPAVLDDLGLIPALHSFVKLFSKRTHLHVHLKIYAGVERLDGNQRTILYRVAQEALTNVARHAQATQVEVNIQKLPHHIFMQIKDDGKSFQVEPALYANGGKRLGLLGMRERLEMIGGSFAIESTPGKGTTVQAQIPLRKTRGGATESAENKF